MTQCKRPPKDTPKAVLKALHKAKMMGKFFRNQDPSYHIRGTILPENHKGVM